MAEKIKRKRKFSEMNNNEKYLYYRKRRRLSIAGKWGSVIAPFGIVFGVKFNEYVNIIDTGEVVKLTIGSVLAIVVACIAVYKEVKHSEETKHLAPAFGWALATVFAWLLKVIIDDLFLILFAETIGQFTAMGINIYGEHCKEEATAYKDIARKDGSIGQKRRKYIYLERQG